MNTYSATTPVSAVAAHPAARAVLEKHLPGILAEPDLALSPYIAVADLGRSRRAVGDPLPDLAPMVAELALLPKSSAGSIDDKPAAAANLPTSGEQWGIVELAWTASTAAGWRGRRRRRLRQTLSPNMDVALDPRWGLVVAPLPSKPYQSVRLVAI